ncbi:MAG: hypothetical protein HOV78_10765 [Hamadaea sp.]|nr:hypothetical protein [Hamadaea sp.]
MRKSVITVVLAAAVSLTGACGPTDTTSSPATTRSSGSTTTPASVGGGGATASAAAKVTPEQLCALMTVAKAAQISGFPIESAEPSMSGDVAVCTYKANVSGTPLGKIITEYQPNAKTLFDLTKAKGQAVAGLGQEAVYFSSSGQLSVRLDDRNLFHCFVLDLRMNHGNPKAGAIQVAKAVVPQLPGA